MSHRLERVAEAIQHEVATIIQRNIADPRVEFVSVTRVEVSADLKHAKVLVSALGEADKVKAALHALQGATGYVQMELSRRLPMKHVPTISFRHDRGLENAIRVTQILEKLEAEKERTDGDAKE